MPAILPALNLIAEPGRRRATLDTAREIERRGFAGISVSSSFGNMSQSVGLAWATERIPFATAIAPIYAQSVDEFAQNGAYLHEVSGGRFQFGIGIAHAPAYVRMEVKPGKPLGDIRAFRMSGPLAGFVTSVATGNPARAMTSAIRQRHPSRTYRYRQGWRRFSRRPRRLGTGPARTRSPRHRYYGFRVGAPELCQGRRQAKSASTGDRQPNRKAVVAARRGR
jgi:hypothetical protein